jgi:hypothetical protein
MELGSPSPYPQEPAICPYPEPGPSSPTTPSNFLKIHLNIILPEPQTINICKAYITFYPSAPIILRPPICCLSLRMSNRIINPNKTT